MATTLGTVFHDAIGVPNTTRETGCHCPCQGTDESDEVAARSVALAVSTPDLAANNQAAHGIDSESTLTIPTDGSWTVRTIINNDATHD